MDTVNKIINDISQKLVNAIVEGSNYKVLYEEAQAQLAETQAQLEQAQAQLEQAQAQLEKINKVLESDKDLKDIFDEVANKLEKE